MKPTILSIVVLSLVALSQQRVIDQSENKETLQIISEPAVKENEGSDNNKEDLSTETEPMIILVMPLSALANEDIEESELEVPTDTETTEHHRSKRALQKLLKFNFLGQSIQGAFIRARVGFQQLFSGFGR